MMRKTAVAVPLAVFALTGCSYGSAVPVVEPSTCAAGRDCGEWMDFDAMLMEWETAAAELDVPAGEDMRPPEIEDFGGGEQEFAERYGESIAHTQWFCLWEGDLLAQEDRGSAEATAALHQLRLFLETETFREDYGGDVGITNMIEEAAEGKTRRMQNDYDVNCVE